MIKDRLKLIFDVFSRRDVGRRYQPSTKARDAALQRGLKEALLKVRQTALFKELTAQAAPREAIARQAVRQAAPGIEAFVAENLDLGPTDVPGLGGLLKKPLSYRFADLVTLSLSPLLEDVAQ